MHLNRRWQRVGDATGDVKRQVVAREDVARRIGQRIGRRRARRGRANPTDHEIVTRDQIAVFVGDRARGNREVVACDDCCVVLRVGKARSVGILPPDIVASVAGNVARARCAPRLRRELLRIAALIRDARREDIDVVLGIDHALVDEIAAVQVDRVRCGDQAERRRPGNGRR